MTPKTYNRNFQKQNIQRIINALIGNKESILYKPIITNPFPGPSPTVPNPFRIKYKNIQSLKEAAFMKAHDILANANGNINFPILTNVADYRYIGIEKGSIIDPNMADKKEPCPAAGCVTMGSFGCWLQTWKYYSGKSKTETPQLKPCAL